VWGRLSRELALELAELSDLLATVAELPPADGSVRPSRVEILAAGAILHSFYNGAENLLRRIEIATHASVPRGEHWHTQLLDRAAHDTVYRPRVLSDSLHTRLDGYLRFRHAFRHLYAQHLDWGRMGELIGDLPAVLESLEVAIRDFLVRLDAWPAPSA